MQKENAALRIAPRPQQVRLPINGVSPLRNPPVTACIRPLPPRIPSLPVDCGALHPNGVVSAMHFQHGHTTTSPQNEAQHLSTGICRCSCTVHARTYREELQDLQDLRESHSLLHREVQRMRDELETMRRAPEALRGIELRAEPSNLYALRRMKIFACQKCHPDSYRSEQRSVTNSTSPMLRYICPTNYR